MIGKEPTPNPRSFVITVWILSIIGFITCVVAAAHLGDIIGGFIRALVIG